MRIQAYCMAYDEADWIARYVKSALKYCDGCIVFDNGSADGTPDIAMDAGAEVVMVDPPQPRDCKDYNDPRFGHGWRRNWCIDRLKDKGDWIFNMDADEELIAPDSRILYKLIAENPNKNVFSFNTYELWGDEDLYRIDHKHTSPWLWKNGIGIRYSTTTPPHEPLVFDDGKNIYDQSLHILEDKAKILHYHYTRGWKALRHHWGTEENRIRSVEELRKGSDPKIKRLPWLP